MNCGTVSGTVGNYAYNTCTIVLLAMVWFTQQGYTSSYSPATGLTIGLILKQTTVIVDEQ